MFSLQSVLHIVTHLSTFCIMLLEYGTCFAFPSYLRPIFLCFNLSAIIFKTIKHFSYCHTSLSTHEIMFLLTSLSVLCLKIFIKLPASISYRKKLGPLGLASYTSSVWWRHWFCSLIPFHTNYSRTDTIHSAKHNQYLPGNATFSMYSSKKCFSSSAYSKLS